MNTSSQKNNTKSSYEEKLEWIAPQISAMTTLDVHGKALVFPEAENEFGDQIGPS